MRKTYDTLVGRLKELGPLRVDAVKSSINLVSKYYFRAVSVRPTIFVSGSSRIARLSTRG